MKVSIRDRDDHIFLTSDGDRVDLYRDDAVGDWVVVSHIGEGVGQPGGITDRSDAILYGLHLLGVVDKPEGVRPVDRC